MAVDGPPPDVVALAARVPQWQGHSRRVVALGGGLTNHNWLVTVPDGPLDHDGEQFVLRSPGANSALLGIDRDHERAAARARRRTRYRPRGRGVRRA